MKNIIFRTFNITLLALLSACGSGQAPLPESTIESKAVLGQALFSDMRFSQNRSQSCATCHNPEHGFVDNRLGPDNKIAAASLGDDGVSLGDRNAPTAAYAAFSPDFHSGSRARLNSSQADYVGFLGGQFLDGRESGLQGQAGGPPLAAGEMNLPDKQTLSDRVQENKEYIAAFTQLFGESVFADVDVVFSAFTESIAAFEQTAALSPFSSKYDKSLLSPPEFEYNPLSKAAAGKALFFSQQFTNCATCHQLNPNSSLGETFTSYEYHNIAVPKNDALRAVNGKAASFVDEGLLSNPLVSDASAKGKFKVPTLRNAAVTGPYMHNGAFRDLKTVVAFYDHFQNGSTRTINPETGLPWAAPEVNENVATTELQDGKLLTDTDIESLVCFMRTLTDERYEHLIVEKGIDCSL